MKNVAITVIMIPSGVVNARFRIFVSSSIFCILSVLFLLLKCRLALPCTHCKTLLEILWLGSRLFRIGLFVGGSNLFFLLDFLVCLHSIF